LEHAAHFRLSARACVRGGRRKKGGKLIVAREEATFLTKGLRTTSARSGKESKCNVTQNLEVNETEEF